MTLIELLVVISILLILAAMVGSGLRGAKRAAQRAQCLSNIRALGQASLLYAESYPGSKFPVSIDTANGGSFALLYDPVDFNDMSVFACPTDIRQGLPRINAAGDAFENPEQLSYNFIYNELGSAGGEPQTTAYPTNNIVLIETFDSGATGSNTFTAADNHGLKGGSAYFLNGKCRLIGGQGNTLPDNRDRSGTEYALTTDFLYK